MRLRALGRTRYGIRCSNRRTGKHNQIGDAFRCGPLERLEPRINPAPALLGTIEGINFDQNAANNGGAPTIPPGPSGAVGLNHVVSAVNSSIQWSTKSGTGLHSQSLDSFFASLSSSRAFDPRVVYDAYADRFVVAALEHHTAPNSSRILLAVSATGDPSGAWYIRDINSRETISGHDCWADSPGFAVDAQAVYLTANMLSFGGPFVASRLWIIDKGVGIGFYAGQDVQFARFDPPILAGVGSEEFGMQPAMTYGPEPGNLGTFLLNSGWVDGNHNSYLNIIRIDSPLNGTPGFVSSFINLGNIDNVQAGLPDAPQWGTSVKVSTGDGRITNAEWRNNQLYAANTVNPPSGPDTGQATAHWYRFDTTNLPALSLADQGNVGGEEIAAATATFYPSISVDSQGNMAIGFAASGPSIDPGAYYTGRLASDNPGTVQPVGTLAAGTDAYVRTFGSAKNRWGDVSTAVVDPGGSSFWLFNEYATDHDPNAGSDNGRWGTRWGNFSFQFAPPTLINIEPSPISYTENDPPTSVTNTLAISPGDSPTLNQATVSIGSFVSGQDVLTFDASGTSITGNFDSSTGVLTLTGTDSPENYRSVLRSVKYQNTSDNPSTVTRTVTFQVRDSDGNRSNPAARAITITSVNDAPVVAGIESAPVEYTALDPAIQVTNALTVDDPDNLNVAGATVAISAGFAGAEDVLNLDTSGTNISGSYNSTTGVLTLTGSDLLAHYQIALRSVRYLNGSGTPSQATRTISFRVDDGQTNNHASNLQSRDIHVSPPNHAPTANAGGPYTIAEGGSLSLDASGSSDPDGDLLTYVWDVNGDGTFGDAAGKTPTLSWAQLQALSPPVDDGPATVSIRVRVDDGHGHIVDSAPAKLTVNDTPPTILTSGSNIVNEGSAYTLTLGPINDPGRDTVTQWIVHWGDGISSAYTGGGNKTHVYADGPATYGVNVDLIDEDGTHLNAGNALTVGVQNVPPALTLSGNQVVDEGATLSIPALGRISDPGFGVSESFTFRVDWGDGTAADHGSASIDRPGGPGVPTLAHFDGSHIFADNGTYTVAVTATDQHGGSDTQTFQVLVNNVKPVLTLAANQTVNEGAMLSLAKMGQISDPGFDNPANPHGGSKETFTFSIRWGDGTPATNGSATIDRAGSRGLPTLAHIDGNHVFADDGSYTVVVTVSDDDGGSASGTFQVIVRNVNPTLIVAAGRNVLRQQRVSIADLGQISDPGFDNPANPHGPSKETFTYRVSWGDGSASIVGAATVDRVGAPGVSTLAHIAGAHRFTRRGTFTITVSVSDDDGGSSTKTTTVVVRSADIVAVGAEAGVEGRVRVYDALTGARKFDITPYPGFTGGVRASVGDVNNDGIPDVITGPGPGGGPQVRVFDGRTGAQLAGPIGSFMAYSPAFAGGVFVAAGDVNGDGFTDVIAGAGAGGGPDVRVFDGRSGALLGDIMAYPVTFSGGVRVAAGDVNGDGKADVLTGAGPGGAPHVEVFDGTNLNHVLVSFLAFDVGYAGGVFVAAGDLDGDGKADMIVSQGQGNPARVRIFRGRDGTLRDDLTPFGFVPPPGPYVMPGPGGLRVSVVDQDGDGLADIVVGTGSPGRGAVRILRGSTLGLVSELSFSPFDPAFLGGVFVG
jgi:hypothetical protein